MCKCTCSAHHLLHSNENVIQFTFGHLGDSRLHRLSICVEIKKLGTKEGLTFGQSNNKTIRVHEKEDSYNDINNKQ